MVAGDGSVQYTSCARQYDCFTNFNLKGDIMSIKELVDRIIEDGVITKAEHEEFLLKVKENGKIDSEESKQISRLRKMIEKGELKIE